MKEIFNERIFVGKPPCRGEVFIPTKAQLNASEWVNYAWSICWSCCQVLFQHTFGTHPWILFQQAVCKGIPFISCLGLLCAPMLISRCAIILSWKWTCKRHCWACLGIPQASVGYKIISTWNGNSKIKLEPRWSLNRHGSVLLHSFKPTWK